MDRLIIHPEVREAIDGQRPVVLLETAVMTTGLPRSPWCWPGGERVSNQVPGWRLDQPVNLELAINMSSSVRAGGATPATTAIVDGCWHVGLEREQLETLAFDQAALKASVTTAAAVIHDGLSAGTTVSGALAAARLIQRHEPFAPNVLATGGIGGVHHGWSDRPDVSADLRVLAGTPVAVVSAGVKSIVDVAATGEWLETLGIPVLGLGTSDFPCFIAGVDKQAPRVRAVHDEKEAAAVTRCHWEAVDPRSGILLAVPIEAGSALPRDMVEEATRQAEAAASEANIDGPARTPFLLSHMAESTSGASLVANIELLLQNAGVAARLACHLRGVQS